MGHPSEMRVHIELAGDWQTRPMAGAPARVKITQVPPRPIGRDHHQRGRKLEQTPAILNFIALDSPRLLLRLAVAVTALAPVSVTSF
jgi:hypothetical protein